MGACFHGTTSLCTCPPCVTHARVPYAYRKTFRKCKTINMSI